MMVFHKVGVLLLGVVGFCVFTSCAASQDVKSIESAIKAATAARHEHDESSFDINLPFTAYSNRLIDVNNALNKSWEKNKNKDFARYLLRLWNNDSVSIPDESMTEVRHPVVKLEIARLLGQANKLCLVNVDGGELRRYVRQQLHSDNKLVKLGALDALGATGNNDDIPALSDIIVSDTADGWAETAVQSLNMLQTDEAIKKLRELKEKVERQSLKDFIKNLLSQYGAGFSGFRAPACNR